MGVPYYGDFAEDDTVNIPFNTFTSDDPSASCTITNFINTDVHIHKDGGTTQRNNAGGITVSVDFDSITGNHLVTIDTSDDTVAGFWVTGSEYQVRIEGTTVDGATLNVWIGAFSIERAGGALALLKNATYGLSALETLVDDLESRLGTPTDFGSGTSTIAANLQDLADNGTAAFDRSTDSLQALRDHIGDGTNLTEAGGDGDHLTEAGGDGDHLTEAGSDGDHLTAIPWNASWDAEVESEVDDALGGGTGTALTAIPWNAAWDAQVQSEVADALDAAMPATPTADSLNERILEAKYCIVNKMVITEATGNTVIYKDDDTNAYATVAAAFDSDGTDTTRKRLE